MNAPAPGPVHLLGVWNPSYADDPLDAHVRLLLDRLDDARQGRRTFDTVYVWWGRLRSPHRRGGLPHLDSILALQRQIERGIETHLYLTDYRSLVVALVDRVDKDVDRRAEQDHVPAYYGRHEVDVWFRIRDVRRLVSNDTVAVIHETRKLHNLRYHNAPVSLYGGMVELPLLVTHEDRPQWFAHREALLGPGHLWAERERQRQDVESLGIELRDHVLGRRVWGALTFTARAFLASAEAVYRSRRFDPAFDFSGVVLEYMKALEVELHDLVFLRPRAAVRPPPPERRRIRLDQRTVDPLDVGLQEPLSLGDMVRVLNTSDGWIQAVAELYPNFEALRREWVPRLRAWVGLRNRAAHKERLSLQEAERAREEVLGIGCDGLVAQIGRLKADSFNRGGRAPANRELSPPHSR